MVELDDFADQLGGKLVPERCERIFELFDDVELFEPLLEVAPFDAAVDLFRDAFDELVDLRRRAVLDPRREPVPDNRIGAPESFLRAPEVHERVAEVEENRLHAHMCADRITAARDRMPCHHPVRSGRTGEPWPSGPRAR